jgi:O-acetylhomoserine/O-acetylserine sulfhydrylase-like pyridoxal-dependent enzyme
MSQEHATNWRFSTRAIHVGQEPDPVTGATVPPIHPTSTYTQASPGKHKGYEYSRSSNPTRVNLEMALASLENGTKGACFASGSAATACIFATLSPGDKVLAYGDVYGGTFRLLKRVFEGFGLVPVFTEDCSPQGFSKLIDAKTKIVWIADQSAAAVSGHQRDCPHRSRRGSQAGGGQHLRYTGLAAPT